LAALAGISLPLTIYYKRRRNREKREDLSSKLTQISNLFIQNVDKLAIDAIAEKLEMERMDLLAFMIQNYDKLEGIRIKGDYVTLSSENDVNQFIKLLDDQFLTWKSREKDKLGKK
jgi:hypothetical protein